jgi:hypothetical protein
MVGIGKESYETTLFTPVYKGYPLTPCAALSADDAKDLEGRGMFIGHFDSQQLELEEQTVSVIRIDDLKLNPVMVKIDIEGGELSALQGMEETLKRSRPVLIVESHKQEIKEIMKFLKSLDYDLIDMRTMQLPLSDRLIPLVNNVFWPRGLEPKTTENQS